MRFLSRIPTIVWFLVPTLIILVVGVYVVTKVTNKPPEDATKPEAVSKPVEGTTEYTIVSREHIAEGTNGSGYNSNPPSSGPHWATPAAKGVSDSPLPDERTIHNLEHGYIWITYKPDKSGSQSAEASLAADLKKDGLSGDDVSKLKDLVKADEYKMIMSPREGNDSKIAIVAWGRVLKMDTLDINKVKEFIKTYRNRGPEKTMEG